MLGRGNERARGGPDPSNMCSLFLLVLYDTHCLFVFCWHMSDLFGIDSR